MKRSQVNMLLLFLLATLGIANVVSHIDRSFQPRTAAANESEALTGSPRLSRARRVAIYNGQGVVKVCHLRWEENIIWHIRIHTYLVCRRCGASREASGQGPIVLVLLQSTESVYTHNDTNLLVELLEHHSFCFYGPWAAQRNANHAASGWHSQLVLRCHWDGHGAVSVYGTIVLHNSYSALLASLSRIARLDGSERGSTCLLRSICEISQLPFDGSNIFSEILNAILMWVYFLSST